MTIGSEEAQKNLDDNPSECLEWLKSAIQGIAPFKTFVVEQRFSEPGSFVYVVTFRGIQNEVVIPRARAALQDTYMVNQTLIHAFNQQDL